MHFHKSFLFFIFYCVALSVDVFSYHIFFSLFFDTFFLFLPAAVKPQVLPDMQELAMEEIAEIAQGGSWAADNEDPREAARETLSDMANIKTIVVDIPKKDPDSEIVTNGEEPFPTDDSKEPKLNRLASDWEAGRAWKGQGHGFRRVNAHKTADGMSDQRSHSQKGRFWKWSDPEQWA